MKTVKITANAVKITISKSVRVARSGDLVGLISQQSRFDSSARNSAYISFGGI